MMWPSRLLWLLMSRRLLQPGKAALDQAPVTPTALPPPPPLSELSMEKQMGWRGAHQLLKPDEILFELVT